LHIVDGNSHLMKVLAQPINLTFRGHFVSGREK
jgi:hypothetical protein